MKKQLSLSQYVVLTYLVTGAGWLISGIADILWDNVLGSIIGLIAAIVMVTSIVLAGKMKRDSMDEMGKAHLNQAYSFCILCVLAYFMLVKALSFLLRTFCISGNVFASFGLAAATLSFGIKFILLEKVGD